jgi:diacylglycerol kinase (ATP)
MFERRRDRRNAVASRRVGVIVNATAGRMRKHPVWIEELGGVCEGRARLYVTHCVEDLMRATRQMAAEPPDAVALCGGDGTHMAGVTSLARQFGEQNLPPLCLVKGGNAGTVAGNWSPTKLNPVGQLRRLIEVCGAPGQPIPTATRPSLRVCGAQGGQRIGFIFGAGLIATFFEEFYRRGGGGYRDAAILIARVFAGSLVGAELARKVLSARACRLTVDETPHPSEAFTLIACAVVRNLGMHLMVTPRAAHDPQRPHLVASSIGVRECGLQFWRILAGRGLVGDGNVDALVNRFRVDYGPQGGSFVLDGELIHAEHVEVTAGPRLRIVCAW